MFWCKIWPRGLFGIKKNEKLGIIHVMEVTICGFRQDTKISSTSQSLQIKQQRSRDFIYTIFFGSTLNACLVGLYVHFIPCIWWTCDWGDNDGEGIRGAIWFTIWIILGIYSILSTCLVSPSQALTLKLENEETLTFYLDTYESAVKVRDVLVSGSNL